MSDYRQKIEGFVWPSCLRPEIRWLARSEDGVWWGFEFKPVYRSGDWTSSSIGVESWSCDGVELPSDFSPMLLCRDDYVTNAEAGTPDVTAMEKALREISRIANAKLSPLEQDAAMEIIASKCYEVLGE